MASSAAEVAAEIRRRIPGIGVKKLHKLLYYCQGHHLSGIGQPLFSESVSAWDMGPVVGQLWKAEKDGSSSVAGIRLGEAELNTIGYVLSRYGRLTARDLEHMTHAEEPWRRADVGRPAGGSTRIRPEWIADYFRTEPNDDDGPVVSIEAVRRFVRGAEGRRDRVASVDTEEAIRARTGRRG